MTELLRGREVPRIYTPPRRELTPETTDGFACIAFAEQILKLTLFPWEKWLLIHGLELNDDYTYRFRTVVVEAARQNGKAVDCDEDVLTVDGWKKMGELVSGDQVFHPEGYPTTVIDAFAPYLSSGCYVVETTDQRRLVVDGEHLWTVQDIRRKGGRVWETLTTNELIARGVNKRRRDGSFSTECAYRLPKQHKIVSKPVELPIDPYVLGLWLGDGDSASGRLSVGHEDLGDITQQLRDAGATITSVRWSKTCYSVTFNVSDRMRDGFMSRAKRLGVLNNKHVPDMYLMAGTEQRAALLAGLLDSDGYCHKQGQVGFTSTKKCLADAVLYLARSLGYRACKREDRATLHGRDCGANYSVLFTPREHVFRLARKNARIKLGTPLGGRGVVSIKSITKTENRLVRCIKVASRDGLFLAGRDLMPTHNTAMLIVLALWHLYAKGSRQVLATAQDLPKAEDTWTAAVEFAEENEELNELIRKKSLGHPKLLQVTNPLTERMCEYRVATASRRGPRGFTGDFILLDELREHQTWETWAAITKTQMARPRAQCWCFSNAADATGIVLRHQRALAHRELGWPDDDEAIQGVSIGVVDPAVEALLAEYKGRIEVGFFEWSAPPKASRADREGWAWANPSMNWTNLVPDCITDLAIAHALYSDPVDVFDTEVLCRQIESASGGPFPAGAWEASRDDSAIQYVAGKRCAVCVEISTTRSAAYIARASLADDGVAVMGIDEAQPGTDWILPWLSANRSSYSGVVIRTGAGSPVAYLADKLDESVLVEWHAAEIGEAFSEIYDRVRGEINPETGKPERRTLKHLSHPGLDTAAETAAIKMLPGGGWIVDINKSLHDVAPLYAAAGAIWGLDELPDDGPSIYAGPQGRAPLVL